MHGFSDDPFRSDCPNSNNSPQGGVILYYKPNIPIKQRKDLQLINECIVGEIKIDRNKKVFLFSLIDHQVKIKMNLISFVPI